MKSHQDKFEATKGVNKNRNSKTNRHYNDQQKIRSKGQTMIYKILHRKLKLGQHEPLKTPVPGHTYIYKLYDIASPILHRRLID